MMFDTHAHYDDRRFDRDRDALLSTMPGEGVGLILNASSDLDSAKKSLEIAERHPFVFAAIGVHPHEARLMDDSTINELERLLKHQKAVAVGEIGLDYHYDHSPRDVQKRRFREQLELARRLKLPAIVHEREATKDTLEIVSDYPDVSGVFHCFSGSWETARFLLSRGWYLSFAGVITFDNARRSHEVISRMPKDRILVETDCPYLAPVPVRGRRNSSLYLKYTVEKLADILGVPFEEAAAKTAENGCRLFGIKMP